MKCEFCQEEKRSLILVAAPPTEGYLEDLVKWMSKKYIICNGCILLNRKKMRDWLTSDFNKG